MTRKQRNEARDRWTTEWAQRHLPELGDDETIDKTVKSLESIWHFWAEMDWLRYNPEALHEDYQTTNKLMAAIDEIQRFIFRLNYSRRTATAHDTAHEPVPR